MNSIVDELKEVVDDEYEGSASPSQCRRALDLIEQQAARIKELEASLASMVQGVKISIPTQTMEQEFQSHYRRGYEAGKAALRQRIDDAPAVAITSEFSGFARFLRGVRWNDGFGVSRQPTF